MIPTPPILASTLTHTNYPLSRLDEYSEAGESLEVKISAIPQAIQRKGKHIWQRFADFMPFHLMKEEGSLGEGNTPLLKASPPLAAFCGSTALWLKNETQNPTCSFKDRGSFACLCMAEEMKEDYLATISTGNMGHSIAAYGAHSGKKVLVFVPDYTPREKLLPIAFQGAVVLRVKARDYSTMKSEVLKMALELKLRVVSGNGAIRVEGYKLTSFEMFEQWEGEIPDFIAVPTSACGHIRGLFKGYQELKESGLSKKLPRMIVVQAANNAPVVQAIRKRADHISPFPARKTVAEAITSAYPLGGDEILRKALDFGWLAEEVTEEEILLSQKVLAENGFFVEASSAVSLSAVKKLIAQGLIQKNHSVVLMLTGSGLKDLDVLKDRTLNVKDVSLDQVRDSVQNFLEKSCRKSEP